MSQAPEGNLYHLILGLPEEVTSPNHYELLGLDHRTSDSEVIKNAATDQNRKLLSWQNSDRYAEVKALTFELVQARDVLLKDESRADYDATLGDWGVEEQGPWIAFEPRGKSAPLPPLSVRCPECEASFKLRNRALVGERIPCPECGVRFTVRPEEEDVLPLAEPWDSDADLKALEDFDDADDTPASRSPAVARTQRRRNADRDRFSVETDREDYRDRSPRARRPASRPLASRGAAKSAAIAGGALMLLGCLVLAGILIYGSASSQASALEHELAYLPADCQALGYCRIGDVSRSPFFQDYLTRSAQTRRLVDVFRDRTGMELSEIDSVIVGLRGKDLVRFNALGSMQPLQGLKFVAVARAAKDWDREKLIGTRSQSATHNNHTYHVYTPEPNFPEQWAFTLIDAKTLIFGTPDEVQAAIDTGGNTPDWPDVEFLQPDYPVVNASINGSASFRPVSLPVPAPADANARTQGMGLMLSSDEVRQVTFLRFESASAAEGFVDTSLKSEANRQRFRPSGFRSPGGTGGMTFTQHGRAVAVAQGGVGSAAGPMLAQAIAPSIALLARLGASPANIVDGSNSQPRPAPAPPVVNPNPGPRQNVPAEPLDPAPDAATLTGLVASLQNPNEAKDAARRLAKMQPDPNRQKQVAKLLETIITEGGHFDKQAAADALGVWGTSENVPFLLGILQNPAQSDTFLNRHILAALGRLKDARALPVLIDSLKNIGLRSEAAKGLTSYGSGAEPELLKTIASSDWQQQQVLCDVLRDIGTAQSLPMLDALAATGHIYVKSRAQAAATAIRAAAM